jgi:hypothetical protein
MKTFVGVAVSPQPPSSNTTIVLDGMTLAGLGFLVAASLGGLRFVLNRAIAQIDGKLKDMADRLEKIEEVEASIQDFKLEAARQYVTREEWIRAVTVSDAKLDAVHRRLDQISDRIMMILTKGERHE